MPSSLQAARTAPITVRSGRGPTCARARLFRRSREAAAPFRCRDCDSCESHAKGNGRQTDMQYCPLSPRPLSRNETDRWKRPRRQPRRRQGADCPPRISSPSCSPPAASGVPAIHGSRHPLSNPRHGRCRREPLVAAAGTCHPRYGRSHVRHSFGARLPGRACHGHPAAALPSPQLRHGPTSMRVMLPIRPGIKKQFSRYTQFLEIPGNGQ